MSQKVEKSKLFVGGYTYDYRTIKTQMGKFDRNPLRLANGINETDFTYLFVGKLISTRRVKDLIDAFEGIEEKEAKLIIGNGEEKAIVDYAIQHDRRIVSIPRVNLEHLYDYYAIADAYIHPGSEPYSCAIMQAAAAGLPVIATDKVGAIDDFIAAGNEELIIPMGNVEE